MFDKKKKNIMIYKIFYLKNACYILGMKLKTTFPKCAFDKEDSKEMGSRADLLKSRF